jgi:acyl-CoA thioesterase FadM
MQVQAKDVDMYGVVTNTMYHKYMYAARAALGVAAGLSMEVLLGQYGIMMATTSFNITFKRCAKLCC